MYLSSIDTVIIVAYDTLKVNNTMNQLMRLWYLSHRRPAEAQASLCIHTVSPNLSVRSHEVWK